MRLSAWRPALGVIAAGLVATLASACTGYVSGPTRGVGPMGAAGTPRLAAVSRHGLPPVSTTVRPLESRFDVGSGPAGYACQRRVASENRPDLGEPMDIVLARVSLDLSLGIGRTDCGTREAQLQPLIPARHTLLW